MSTRDMKPVSLPAKDGESSTQIVEESQPSVQALKTVFNATKTEAAPHTVPVATEKKVVETQEDVNATETEESADLTDNNDTSGDVASAGESPLPNAEEESPIQMESVLE